MPSAQTCWGCSQSHLASQSVPAVPCTHGTHWMNTRRNFSSCGTSKPSVQSMHPLSIAAPESQIQYYPPDSSRCVAGTPLPAACATESLTSRPDDSNFLSCRATSCVVAIEQDSAASPRDVTKSVASCTNLSPSTVDCLVQGVVDSTISRQGPFWRSL